MCTLLSLKKVPIDLSRLYSSQVLCWFHLGAEQDLGAAPAYGAESTGPALLPPQATGLASRDRKLLDLPVGGKEMKTHGGWQGLAKEAEIIFGDQDKKWVRKREVGAVKTTGTKKGAMDGEGKGEP